MGLSEEVAYSIRMCVLPSARKKALGQEEPLELGGRGQSRGKSLAPYKQKAGITWRRGAPGARNSQTARPLPASQQRVSHTSLPGSHPEPSGLESPERQNQAVPVACGDRPQGGGMWAASRQGLDLLALLRLSAGTWPGHDNC